VVVAISVACLTGDRYPYLPPSSCYSYRLVYNDCETSAESSSMSGERLLMKNMFIRVLLFGGGVWFFAVGSYVVWLKKPEPAVLLIIGLLLVFLAIINPSTIKKIIIGKSGLEIERHKPDEKEKKDAQAAGKGVLTEDEKKELETLRKEAEKRTAEERSPEDYIVLATDAWQGKDWDKAFEYAYAGLALNPKDKRTKATLVHRLASVFDYSENKEIGEEKYKEAIKIDQTFSWPHNNLGLLFEERGELEKAEELFEKAFVLDSENEKAKRNLELVRKKIKERG